MFLVAMYRECLCPHNLNKTSVFSNLWMFINLAGQKSEFSVLFKNKLYFLEQFWVYRKVAQYRVSYASTQFALVLASQHNCHSS